MKKCGFTLTEILIVLVILGVIAGLAIPNYFRSVEQARSNEARVNLAIIDMAQRVYFQSQNPKVYYPNPAGTQATLATINTDLSTDMSVSFYPISITSTGATYTATATRTGMTKTFTVSRGFGVGTDGIIVETGEYIKP